MNSGAIATSSKLTPRPIDNGVLANPYILQRIFDHLIPEYPPFDASKQHLLWVALTTRSFLEPALDSLWATMTSLIPLLKLLPAFQLVRDTYVLRGTMQEKDWDRYWYYARRVKVFIYPGESGEDEKLVNHTKVRLAQLWKSPLLPVLQRFICPEVQAPGLFIHTLFLTPTLESVELRFVSEPEDVAIGSVLSTMVEQTPSLQNLVIWGTLSKQSLSFLPHFHRLRSLELKQMGSSIDSQFFSQLGKLRYLSELAIDLFGSPSSDFTIEPDGFPSLSNLRITASYPITEAILMNHAKYESQPQQLSSLAIIAIPAPLPQGWEAQLTNLLSKVCRHWSASLKSLMLDQDTEWEHASLSMSTISPILRLTNLTSFRIERYTILFSNDDIQRFASAWSGLETLHLPLDPRISTRSRNDELLEPSLDALFMLSESCPRLKAVQMPVYVKCVPSLSSYTSLRSSLEELVVGCHNGLFSTTEELLPLAKHLDQRFPRLKVLKHMKDVFDMWEKIHLMVLAIRSTKAVAA